MNIIPFDKALIEIVGRRAPDRERIYRKFLRSDMRHQTGRREILPNGEVLTTLGPDPTDEAVASVVARHKAEGFTPGLLAEFKKYFALWEPAIKRERALAGSRARWKKTEPAAKSLLTATKKSKKSIKHPIALR